MEWLSRIAVELGPAAYAEPYDADTLLKMPANALVNGLYVVVGLAWLARTRGPAHATLRPLRARFDAFALMAIAYGALQFTRIVTQDRLFAVLDQWATFPFFAYVV